ncbi:unnamed protein product [Microthlaspi erraticum]|uniref:Uncharacterized protein n=1 Tax=Microthlaspi erraticum TaxID=1685480 RepID=A0A6D2HNV6_9BRAS|nr:unnamed protein product [Microthlaspi erraticum]
MTRRVGHVSAYSRAYGTLSLGESVACLTILHYLSTTPKSRVSCSFHVFQLISISFGAYEALGSLFEVIERDLHVTRNFIIHT